LADDQLLTRGACSALVITCSDFRFKTAERTFLEAAGLADDYDLIARPGAIRSLVAPRDASSRDTMLGEIEMLWQLHRFERVLMLNHMSCRAYDDLAAGDAQRAVHESHLRAAAADLQRRYGGLTSEPYLIAMVDGALRVERQDPT
jgi:Putative carbonic anhydrase